MSDEVQEKVSRLLQEGLECYGTGDVGRAFLLWGEVLELDPDNAEALDYMRDADRRAKPRGGGGQGGRSVVEAARRKLRGDDAEGALDLLVRRSDSAGLAQEAMCDLVRATLYLRYREEVGDPTRIPVVDAKGKAALDGRDLPPRVGFFLSMIDGRTPLGDLVSASGMDRFEALRSVHHLHRAGVLGWRAA
jgi:hypothetical protein